MPGKMITGQVAEIPGPQKALIIQNAESMATMVKRASRPLFVFGSKSQTIMTHDGDLIDTAIKLSENPKNTIVTTAHTIAEFRKRKGDKVYNMQLMNLGDRLRDPDWGGFDGRGLYDLIVFVGFTYYLEWLVLSGLKNFARGLRTISLDRTYQPNAGLSMGLMTEKEWKDTLEKIVSMLVEVK
jgi:anaerobic carbon-monoxide dehydrogenase, CODH/ACS complex subunit epsilon